MNWRSTSDEIVTVWPNITWPTSIVTFFAGVDRLGELRRGGGEAVLALLAVAVELQMGQMQRQVLGGGDGRERRLDIAGKAKIVAVDMQRMRHAGRVHRPLQRLDDRARLSAVFGHHVVEREGPACCP